MAGVVSNASCGTDHICKLIIQGVALRASDIQLHLGPLLRRHKLAYANSLGLAGGVGEIGSYFFVAYNETQMVLVLI